MIAMAGRKLTFTPGEDLCQKSNGALKSDAAYPVVLLSECKRTGKDNVERDEIQVGIVADNGRLWTLYPSKGMLAVEK